MDRKFNLPVAQNCMVSLTYQSSADFYTHVPISSDNILRSCDIGDVSTLWFIEVKRKDRKYARILILQSEDEVQHVLDAYPAAPQIPRPTEAESDDHPSSPPSSSSLLTEASASTSTTSRIVAAAFPGKAFEKNLEMFIPGFSFEGWSPSLKSLTAAIMQMKYDSDRQIVDRLEMQRRLSRAYIDCRRAGGADLKAFDRLHKSTAMVRNERVRYHPEVLSDQRHRMGAGSFPDVGLTKDGVVVDLLTDEWRRF